MTTDLTFQQINDQLGVNVFELDNGSIKLNANLLTGDTLTALNNTGVIEFCFKLLKACYDTQESVNQGNTVNPLSSFSAPFYSTVQEGSPPSIEGSITVTGVIPLDINSLVGAV